MRTKEETKMKKNSKWFRSGLVSLVILSGTVSCCHALDLVFDSVISQNLYASHSINYTVPPSKILKITSVSNYSASTNYLYDTNGSYPTASYAILPGTGFQGNTSIWVNAGITLSALNSYMFFTGVLYTTTP